MKNFTKNRKSAKILFRVKEITNGVDMYGTQLKKNLRHHSYKQAHHQAPKGCERGHLAPEQIQNYGKH